MFLSFSTSGLFVNFTTLIVSMFLSPQGHLRQLTFLMGDLDAAQQHCSHHPPHCGDATPKSPRSTRTNNALEVRKDEWKRTNKKSGHTICVITHTHAIRKIHVISHYCSFDLCKRQSPDMSLRCFR